MTIKKTVIIFILLGIISFTVPVLCTKYGKTLYNSVNITQNGSETEYAKADTGKEKLRVQSLSRKTAWSGSEFALILNGKPLDPSDIKVNVGGRPARVLLCIGNTIRVKTPKGLPAEDNKIRLEVDGRTCNCAYSIRVLPPEIVSASFQNGSWTSLNIRNIESGADSVRVFFNEKQISDFHIRKTNGAGNCAVRFEAPKDTKGGEIFIVCGLNKSNTVSLSRS